MSFSETEVVFGKTADRELKAILYRPDIASDEPVPFAIDIHGGAWSVGHYKTDRYYNRKLAVKDIAVMSIDFRYGPEHKHPAANADIRAAIQYARESLDFETSTFGLIGSSSGGHLALLSGLKPDAEEHHGTLVAADDGFVEKSSSAVVDFVIGLWPVSNPLARYQYATARTLEDTDDWAERLVAAHRGYFENEAAMQHASVQRVLSESEYESLPRVFIVQPELDVNVPVFMSQTLHGALMNVGAEVTYKLYAGVGHAFGYADGPKTDECIDDMAAFINGGTVST